MRSNASGFRSDIDYANTKTDRPRILFFGDSITAGDGCNNAERFSELIGDHFDAEVFNYGLSGSGTDQQLLILEELARGVEADLIVLAVTVHNIDRIKSRFRPTIDRITRDKLLVPKPYFSLGTDDLELHNVPVPLERPLADPDVEGVYSPDTHRDANAGLAWVYRLADGLRKNRYLGRMGRFLSPRSMQDHTRLRGLLLRNSGFDPYPDYRDPASEGYRLLDAIVGRFVRAAEGIPVLLVPMPDQYYFLTGLRPTYQTMFDRHRSASLRTEVFDLTSRLLELPFAERRKLYFPTDAHFTPAGHEAVARAIAEGIETMGVLGTRTPAKKASTRLPNRESQKNILGISCFYHNSAASLIRDGEIIAAAEEERFTRVKADRRFPGAAINFCLEQGEIDCADLDAVVYYDSSALTFERLVDTAVRLESTGGDLWSRVMPSWIQYKLHLPSLIRRSLGYKGLILQNFHHRSHAAGAFFPSPFDSAAILTVDGVGEWATATIGVGRGNEIKILREMRFPNSLGLLYSAFTQFTGFRVNDGEYKLMGLAPYGRPVYADKITEHLIKLHEDGSVALNMEYFAFLAEPRMTNEKFAELFGGPARREEERITQREMDIARSIQVVTEEALLRMAREARRLTGEERLVLSGGVALNCVANGRILREGPFEDLWIQPAAGDSGSSLGAALDAYHCYFGMPRNLRPDGRSIQSSTFLGPEYSETEISSFLNTYGYPFRAYDDPERAEIAATALADGKVVGHFAGRTEFGPRALGSRSILGDPRNREMQVTLNLKIKYRESFRPFAPVVLADDVSKYFEIDRESPYMLLVAPVRQERRLPYNPADDEDMLKKVKMARSDLPAITHVDYSARIQTIRREDHQPYFDVLTAFKERTDCSVLVNTSFNVRGEPIVNTPEDAYRCFMRTEMDVLVLGNHVLRKEDQPPGRERKGHMDDREDRIGVTDSVLTESLNAIWSQQFLPAVRRIGAAGDDAAGDVGNSAWVNHSSPADVRRIFEYPAAMLAKESTPNELAAAVTSGWSDKALAREMKPVVADLLELGLRHRRNAELDEEVPDSIYVMF